VSYEAELDDLMPDTVTFEPFASEDGYGARSYGAAKTVRCRVEQLAKLVRNEHGREVVSNSRLIMKPLAMDGSSYTPTIKDRFTLPAGYAPQQPPAISTERSNDDVGLHHFTVNL
jgi:hypothetical protein